MTPERLRLIRKRLKLSSSEMGMALGYQGERATVGASVRKLEGGAHNVPERVARLVIMFELFGIPADLEKRASK